MAKAQTDNAVSQTADDGWETESQESAVKVSLDEVGDVFTGILLGSRLVEFDDPREGKKEFTVYQFQAMGMEESAGLEDGTLCDIQESFKLKPLSDVKPGRLVRITRMRDVDVNRPQPMKDYRIQSKEV